jgi:hypothetical protein
MYSKLIIKLFYFGNNYKLTFGLGFSDGSGEDDVPQIGSNGGIRQFSDQRGLADRPLQQDMDYSSTTTLWSNSSR